MDPAKPRHMVAVILAGGRGVRLGPSFPEKPLLPVGSVPLLARVLGALAAGPSVPVWVATSPETPKTEAFCRAKGWAVIRTPGRGHASDVAWLAGRFPRFASVAVDLPFLKPDTWARFLTYLEAEGGNWAGVLPEALAYPGGSPPLWWPEPVPGQGRCRLVGVNGVEGTAPSPSRPYVFTDPWIGVNVNAPEDLEMAERLAEPGRRPPEEPAARGLG